jgi:hypothetical protein
VRVESWDRFGLERLARYCARPTFSEGRLSLADPDTVVYTLARPDHQGRSFLTLTPLELIERLSVLFPPPRKHRHRYAGVLAPNSRLRSLPVLSLSKGWSPRRGRRAHWPPIWKKPPGRWLSTSAPGRMSRKMGRPGRRPARLSPILAVAPAASAGQCFWPGCMRFFLFSVPVVLRQ